MDLTFLSSSKLIHHWSRYALLAPALRQSWGVSEATEVTSQRGVIVIKSNNDPESLP